MKLAATTITRNHCQLFSVKYNDNFQICISPKILTKVDHSWQLVDNSQLYERQGIVGECIIGL